MKRIKLVIIFGITATLFVAIVGLSYSFLRIQINGQSNNSGIEAMMGDIRIVFSDSPYINDSMQEPGWNSTKSFTVTNEGSIPGKYSIYWETLTNTIINKSTLLYTITSTNSGGTLSQTAIPSSGYDIPIINNIAINPGVTQTYTINFLYQNTSTDQSADMGKLLSGKIKVESTFYTPKLPLLADAIKMNEPIIRTVADDTMFQNISDASQTGLWLENRVGKTEDDLPVYFFRGAVQNNYVSFAGKMWRIVRINEDGTIKLILGGNTTTDGYGGTTTTYNPNHNAATYVDYSLSTNALKTANETWYSSNIGNNSTYSGKIALTKFCNDKTNGGGTDVINYGAYTRLYTNKTPQYKCPNSSDNLVYNIGALTADEVAYAGGLYASNNASYYLYDNAQSSSTGTAGYWWLLSPSFYLDNAVVFHVNGSSNPGFLSGGNVYGTEGFRPVVSLKSDTEILSGNGTKDEFYIITQ